MQNSAARILTRTKKRAHITPALAPLHWLPVKYRIDFKILLLVFKALTGLAPPYISDLLNRYQPKCALRSSGDNLLCIPKVNYKRSGEASFYLYAPMLWNSLPTQIREAPNVTLFKSALKTYFFRMAFT